MTKWVPITATVSLADVSVNLMLSEKNAIAVKWNTLASKLAKDVPLATAAKLLIVTNATTLRASVSANLVLQEELVTGVQQDIGTIPQKGVFVSIA